MATRKQAKPAISESTAFSGFPQAGFQFLEKLKQNNDREWFAERKAEYEQHVRQPMELLVHGVAAECRRRGLALYAKERNPVMRIYRDIRFSNDKTPFKTHVSAGLRSHPDRENNGELYMHISPAESFLAAGFWMPEREILYAWRERMASQSRAFQKIADGLQAHKLQFFKDGQLSRMPRGFEGQAESPLADYFRLTSYAVSKPLTKTQCKSAGLVALTADFVKTVWPLLEFGWEVQPRKKKDPLRALARESLF